LFEHEESILARAGHQMLSGREEKVEQGNRERARIKGGGKKKEHDKARPEHSHHIASLSVVPERLPSIINQMSLRPSHL